MSYRHRTYRSDGSWWVDWFADDTSRTVTTYDEAGTILDTTPYTAEQNAAADNAQAQTAAQAAQATLTADTTADLDKLSQAITDLTTLLGDEATAGSIKAIIGPTGATAGTTSLRALRAQSNTAVVAAASVKALIDHAISLAQATRGDARATRRIARQTLRLAKQMVGDYSSADVGADLT